MCQRVGKVEGLTKDKDLKKIYSWFPLDRNAIVKSQDQTDSGLLQTYNSQSKALISPR